MSPGVVLVSCGFVVSTAGSFMLSLDSCLFSPVKHCNHLTWGGGGWSVCFSSVYFARVGFCHFSLSLCVRGWLRTVVVALLGLFY